MLTKFIQFFARTSTLKYLAALIIITMIIASFYSQTLNDSPVELNVTNNNSQTIVTKVNTEHNFQETKNTLTEWVISLVDQLHWQQTGNSHYLNVLVLFTFLSLATSIGLPRQIAALVAGINLGAMLGLIVATLATTLGCFITFSISRYLLSDKITRKYPVRLAQLSAFLNEKTFLKALIIRILPLGSNFLTNIIAGVSKVSMPAYVSGSFVGFIPQMIIFSLAGSGIRLGSKNELIVSIVLFIIALALSGYLVKKNRAKRNA